MIRSARLHLGRIHGPGHARAESRVSGQLVPASTTALGELNPAHEQTVSQRRAQARWLFLGASLPPSLIPTAHLEKVSVTIHPAEVEK